MALCDSCHRNPVSLFCHNDNAKLCYTCDLSLHAVCSFMSNHKRVWLCEVCTAAPAVVYCEMDAANMCTTCDELIHGSNILAALHVRQPIEFSKRYLARESQQAAASGSMPDASRAPTANNADSSAAKQNASLANMVMVEGLNTFVAPKANKHEIEDYKRQCEEVLKMNPEMFQQLQSTSLGGHALPDQSLHNRERDVAQSVRMSLPRAMEQAEVRSVSDVKLAELQLSKGLSGGKIGVDSWAPVNFTSLWKTPPNVQNASAILREACNGLGEPDIVDQLLQGLGEQMQCANMANFNSGEDRGMVEQQNKEVQDTQEDMKMGGESAGPSDAFVMPALVLHVGNAQPLDREARVNRYREKRKNRKFQKTIRYASRATYAGNRPRVKGRFAKREEFNGGDDADALSEPEESNNSGKVTDGEDHAMDSDTSSRLVRHSVVMAEDMGPTTCINK